MFSMIQKKPHTERKRMFGNIYSKSVLQTSTTIRDLSQEIIIKRFIPIIEAAAVQGNPLNVLEYNSAVYMDFISAFVFGVQNGANFLQDSKTRERWLGRRNITKGHGFWSMEFPRLTTFLKYIGVHLEPPEIDSAREEVKDLCLDMLQRVENSREVQTNRIQKVHKGGIWTKPVVYDQLLDQLNSSCGKSSSTPLSDSQLRLTVASELMDHIIASTDTTSWTLTYIMHELSQRPDLQSSLRTELFSISPPMFYPSFNNQANEIPQPIPNLPSPRSIDNLPLLDAILLETLRLRPSVPGSQPRIIPSRPALSSISLCGYTDIPPGTRVSSQAYSLHRNMEIFPEPEVWRPERWLDADQKKEEMMRWFWAFGSGGRMCIGNHLAALGEQKNCLPLSYSKLIFQSELKFVVAAIYSNYTTKIIDDEEIEQLDSYSSGPKGDKLILQFEKVR
jgi:cytochrome P450